MSNLMSAVEGGSDSGGYRKDSFFRDYSSLPTRTLLPYPSQHKIITFLGADDMGVVTDNMDIVTDNVVTVLVAWIREYLKGASEESILFSRLVDQWHEERGITSFLSEIFMCPSYQQIIEMGERAVPLILAQLEREGDDPDHWYAALEAITGEDPVPEDAYGDTVQIARAWLSWAEARDVEYSGESRTAES